MVQINEIKSNADDKIFHRLEELLSEMYLYMNATGLKILLAQNGAEIFCDSLRKMVGRNSYLVGAFEDDEMIGFGIASLRLTPPYLGNLKVGAITHIYVTSKKRRNRSGKFILDALEKWLLEKKVHSIELEVLSQNEIGLAFWKTNNYQEELVKMRKNC